MADDKITPEQIMKMHDERPDYSALDLAKEAFSTGYYKGAKHGAIVGSAIGLGVSLLYRWFAG